MSYSHRLPIAVLCLGLVSTTVRADERLVRVTGTAVSRVAPDEVTWSIQVTNRNEALPQAREANERAVNRVLTLARELGVEERDVQTSYLDINKVYHRDNRGNVGEFRHYSFHRSIKIRQTDLSKFDAMLRQLSEIKEIEANYSLSSSEYHKIRRETRLDAVRAAKQKALEVTELLDAKLGRVMVIDAVEKSAPGWGSNRFANNAVVNVDANATPDAVDGTFAPGAIEIRESVEVQFEIQ